MNDQFPITKEIFIKRLGDLCLRSGLSGLPKDEKDQHILLKSAVLLLGQPREFTEKEINAGLDTWVKDVSQIKTLDRVTMRRRLVDTGYLTRSPDGSRYQITRPSPRADLFDPAIDELDILQVIVDAREEIARRKREHTQKRG